MTDRASQILTIVVPCYNADKYIQRCLSSLSRLDANDIAFVFVNDGSVDNTKATIEQWISNHTNAQLVNKENGGYSSAINAGLDHCNTEYVMFMGVDDELIVDGLARICAQLKKDNPDILAFSTIQYYDDKAGADQTVDEAMTMYQNPGLYRMDAYQLYNKIGKDAYILFTRDTSRCFKRSIIGDMRYFGKRGVAADGCFSSIMACRAHSFEFMNEKGYVWHLHSDSVSGSKKSIERVVDETEVWNRFFVYICESQVAQKLPDPIVNHFFEYQRVIDVLRQENMDVLVREHEACVKTFRKWFVRKQRGSVKSCVKMICTPMYKVLLNRSQRP